jgi:alkylhydroperoxidase family enzyme
MQTEGKQLDVAGVTRGFDEDVGIPHAAELVEFTEAVVVREAKRSDAARKVLLAALGEAAFVDACGIVAAFHGFVRIADAIGIPHFTAAGAPDLSDLRAQAGINGFYRMRGTA